MSIPSYGEPWTVERDQAGFDRIFRPDTRRFIALMSDESLRGMACVNALAGLDPAAVREVVEAAEQLLGATLTERPRDRLRSALRKLKGETS